MSSKGPIDWSFALNGVDGDEEFLKEVFADLLRDSARCSTEALDGIESRNFKAIDSAAHEVKGSCSYLGCEALRDASLSLELVGKEGQKEGADHEALYNEAKQKYEVFKTCLEAVRVEVKAKGYFTEE